MTINKSIPVLQLDIHCQFSITLSTPTWQTLKIPSIPVIPIHSCYVCIFKTCFISCSKDIYTREEYCTYVQWQGSRVLLSPNHCLLFVYLECKLIGESTGDIFMYYTAVNSLPTLYSHHKTTECIPPPAPNTSDFFYHHIETGSGRREVWLRLNPK